MIRFPCAGCDKVMNAADQNAGKKAKCPSCGEIVVIPLRSILPVPGEEKPPAKTAPTKAPAVRKPAPPDNGDDEEVETKVAPKRLPAAAKGKPKPPPPEEDEDDIPEVEEVDEDEEDEEDDYEDEEEEEERPKKKKKKGKKPVQKGPY